MTENVSNPVAAGPLAPGAEHDVVRELHEQFGAENFVFQSTLDNVPTLWVPREKLKDILAFLRRLPRPYVMLYDLSATDERLRQNRLGMPIEDYTVFYHLISIERNSDVRIKVALKSDDLKLPTSIGI